MSKSWSLGNTTAPQTNKIVSVDVSAYDVSGYSQSDFYVSGCNVNASMTAGSNIAVSASISSFDSTNKKVNIRIYCGGIQGTFSCNGILVFLKK